MYKLSLKTRESFNGESFRTGNGNLHNLNKKQQFATNSFFFKKNFITKLSFLDKNYSFLNVSFFKKKTGFGNLLFDKKTNLFFLTKNEFNLDFFFTFKKSSLSLKKYNRTWLTLQQQPKTDLNHTLGAFMFFKKKINFYKGLNEFLKNSILVKNRFISVDNVLFLPSRKNITVITNSFDVAHS